MSDPSRLPSLQGDPSLREGDPSLQAGNVQPSKEIVNVAGYVERLLAQHDLGGQEIIDRFIGAVVANGDVQGSQKRYSPAEIFEGISFAASARHKAEGLKDNPQAQEAAQKSANSARVKITNQGGYRDAFVRLASDDRTADLMHLGGSYASLAERGGLYDNKGFASLDVLHSYLAVISENSAINAGPDDVTNPEATISLVDNTTSLVKAFAAKSGPNTSLEGRLRELANYSEGDTQTVAAEGLSYLTSLEQQGADLNLIEATAHRLRTHKQVQGLGSMAGKHVGVRVAPAAEVSPVANSLEKSLDILTGSLQEPLSQRTLGITVKGTLTGMLRRGEVTPNDPIVKELTRLAEWLKDQPGVNPYSEEKKRLLQLINDLRTPRQ